MSFWTCAWLAIGLAAVAVEIPALVNRTRGDTLSEHLKRLLGIGAPVTLGVRLRRFALLALWAWLPVHLIGWI